MSKPFIPLSWSTDNSANQKTTAITTLAGSPQEITFSENINTFSFNPVSASAPFVKSEAFLVVTGYIAIGSTITITSNLASITLTASTAPTVGQFYTEAASTNTQAYREMVAESIADTINKSLAFSNNYEVILQGSAITVEARSFGSNSDFTVLTVTSTNMIANNILGTSRYLSQGQINYSAFAKVYIGDEIYASNVAKLNSVFVDDYTIDSAVSSANLSALVVGDFVEPILPIKSLTQSSAFYQMDRGLTSGGLSIPNLDSQGNRRKILRPYFIEYGDSFSYITNGEKKNLTKGVTSVRWIQLGAVNALDPYNTQDYVWIPNNPKTFKWLTSTPTKTITYDSHEYLQLICKESSNTNNFRLEVTYNFYDGTNVTQNQASYPYTNLGGNISFDVSPLALGILNVETTQGKLIDSFDVRLLWDINSSLSSTSQTKSYKFDRNCYNDTKQIIFLNSYGAWDSLSFRGSVVSTLSRETSTINRGLPFNANTTDAISAEVSLNINTEASTTFQINSGLLSNAEIDWAKELGKSSAVYIWEDNAYKNILIDQFDYSNDSRVNGNNISITYTYTTSDNTIRR